VNTRKSIDGKVASRLKSPSLVERRALDEPSFQRTIALERKRSDRSQKKFLLMLVDFGRALPSENNGHALQEMLSAILLSTRETDVVGWYKDRTVLGVMFTEIALEERGTIHATMMARVSETLRTNLSRTQFNQVTISFHLYPEDWDSQTEDRDSNPVLYPDLVQRNRDRRMARIGKRIVDIIGSLIGLVLLAPVFAIIAVCVKLTSEGPVIFKQRRLGQFGKSFEFVKFRSMYADNDHTLHQIFIKDVINGSYTGEASGESAPVYKMTDDPRITPLGRFLRRTSLDELPQFLNVLKGDMSLVGPRPPLAYEYEEYAIWHRCRVLEAKPGLTGLWQIRGRSRVRFDDMVRLDLQYVRNWTLWLDLQILLQTPKAVLFGGDSF
jgi:lipopolysaccharide/colanic/teichoic acid biosynthesis glycosyltransferase